MTFGEALAQAREFRELRKSDLSKAMNRNGGYAGYIGDIERGNLKPSVEIVVGFAEALDVIFLARPDGWSFRPVKNGQ